MDEFNISFKMAKHSYMSLKKKRGGSIWHYVSIPFLFPYQAGAEPYSDLDVCMISPRSVISTQGGTS